MNQRVEDAVVASSEAERAPEHRFELVLSREFDRDLAVMKLVVSGPLGQRLELTDTRQLEILVSLLKQALPSLGQAETELATDWRVWRDALPTPSRLTIWEGE